MSLSGIVEQLRNKARSSTTAVLRIERRTECFGGGGTEDDGGARPRRKYLPGSLLGSQPLKEHDGRKSNRKKVILLFRNPANEPCQPRLVAKSQAEQDRWAKVKRGKKAGITDTPSKCYGDTESSQRIPGVLKISTTQIRVSPLRRYPSS